MIIATAGHVDHGKTELIKALTGTDTDRLPEEKNRRQFASARLRPQVIETLDSNSAAYCCGSSRVARSGAFWRRHCCG